MITYREIEWILTLGNDLVRCSDVCAPIITSVFVTTDVDHVEDEETFPECAVSKLMLWKEESHQVKANITNASVPDPFVDVRYDRASSGNLSSTKNTTNKA